MRVAAAVAVALAAAGPGAAPARPADDSARAFAVRVVWANLHRRYDVVWSSIYPRYRGITTRTFYVACKRQKARRNASLTWLSVRAPSARQLSVRLPLLGRVRITRVTLLGSVRVPILGTRTVRNSLDVMRRGGRWFAVPTLDEYRAYTGGRCPR